MSGLYTTQQFKTVGIFIAPTIDLTMGLEPSEKGIIGALGKLGYGYPFAPVVMKENTLEIKSTLLKYGGTQSNELAYHLQDFFTAFNGKAVIGRVMGDTSKTAYLTLGKTNEFENGTIFDYDILVTNNMKSDTEYSIKCDYVASTKLLTITALKADATVLWTVSGTTDSRLADYIGLLSDADKYISVNGASEAFSNTATDFSFTSSVKPSNFPIAIGVTDDKFSIVRSFDDTDIVGSSFPLNLMVSKNSAYQDNEELTVSIKSSLNQDDYLEISIKDKDGDILYEVEGSTLTTEDSYIVDKIDENYIKLGADFSDAIFDTPFEVTQVVSGALVSKFIGNIFTSTVNELDVFGANGIEEWADTPISVGEHLELLVKQCFTFKHSITINYKTQTRMMEIKLFDNYNREIYKVEGSIDLESKDDYGIPNFISLVLDSSILDVKLDASNADFDSDFVYVDTLEPYTIDSGTPKYDLAIENIGTYAEKMDYFISGGLYDIKALQDVWGKILFKAKTPMIIDIPYFNNLSSAIKWVKALNLTHEYIVKIWNNVKSDFTNGKQAIGLSGWYVGKSIEKNLSKMVDDVESRIAYSIAGVDYPSPHTYSDAIPDYTQDELDALVDARINTLRIINDKVCLGDALSSYPKWTALRLFANAEAKAFLERYIARIIASKFFKNNNEALRFTRNKVRVLFEKLDEVNTFNKKIEERWKIKVTLNDEDLIIVKYDCVLAGVLRRGKIQGTVSKKITKG